MDQSHCCDIKSAGESQVLGMFLYPRPSRRLCSSLLRQKLLWLCLHFITSGVACCWVYTVLSRSNTLRRKKEEIALCLKSQSMHVEAVQ